MQKKLAIVLAGLMAVLLLASCSGSGGSAAGGTTRNAKDGLNEGDIGDKMVTYFFDFTVDSAESVASYAGITPSEGNQLIDVVVTTTNTAGGDLEMYDTDYQLQWGERDNESTFAVTLDAVDDTMAPLTYDLAKDGTMTYHYLYEAPADVTDFELCYLEEMSDSSGSYTTGDIHYVTFSVK